MTIQSNIPLIAAGSALAGVLISQAISIMLSVLDKKHKKQILLRQKYEQLMFEFQDSLEYFLLVQNCKTVDMLQGCAYSQAAGRAVALAHLYFPSLESSVSQYQQSLISYYGSVVSIFNPHIPATAGAQLQISDKEMKVLNKFNKQKNITLNVLISNAKNYTKA